MNQHPRHEEILTRLQAGEPCKTIATDLHIAATVVYQIRDEHGIPNWYVPTDGPACKHGHPWPEHLAFQVDGTRFCRQCKRAQHNKRIRTLVDELAVERAVAGDPPARLTPSERRQAVARLITWRLDTKEIAERVGCSDRTIFRIRKRLEEAA